MTATEPGAERPTRNVELFDLIADHIERLPWAYDQGEWITVAKEAFREDAEVTGAEVDCGTRMCIAGWAVDLTGWKMPADWPEGMSCARVEKDGESGSVRTIAREALGLTVEESEILFDACWGPEDAAEVPDLLRAIGRGTAPIVYSWGDAEA